MSYKESDNLKKFNSLTEYSEELLKNGKFDKSLSVYLNIKKMYNNLNFIEKEKAMDKFEDLQRQLIILMNMKEANILMVNNVFHKLPEKFDHISFMLESIKKNMKNKKEFILLCDKKLAYYRLLYRKNMLVNIGSPEIKLTRIREEINLPKIKEVVKEKVIPLVEETPDIHKLLEENRFSEVRKILKKGF